MTMLAASAAALLLLPPGAGSMRPEARALGEILHRGPPHSKEAADGAAAEHEMPPVAQLAEKAAMTFNMLNGTAEAEAGAEELDDVVDDPDAEGVDDAIDAAHEFITSELDKAFAVGIEQQGWSLMNVVAAVVLIGAWAFFPCFLAMAKVPHDFRNALDPSIISVVGAYPAARDCLAEGAQDTPEPEVSMPVSAGLSVPNRKSMASAPSMGGGGGGVKVPPLLRRILTAEVAISAIQPFIVASILGVIALIFGAKEAVNLHTWALVALLVLPVIRVIRVECRLAGCSVFGLIWDDLTKITLPPFYFMGSKYEVLDNTLDGMTMMSVYVLESHNELFKERIGLALATFRLGWVLAPMSATIGLSGMLFIMQIVAGVMQVASVLIRLEDDIWVAAQIAGFGGLAVRLRDVSVDEVDDEDTEYHYLSQTFYEALPQMFVQIAAIVGSGTGLIDLPVLVVSVASSMALLFWRSCVLMQIGICGRGATAIIGGLVMFGMSAYMCVWLGMSETCDSLIYDVRNKVCVDAPTVASMGGNHRSGAASLG